MQTLCRPCSLPGTEISEYVMLFQVCTATPFSLNFPLFPFFVFQSVLSHISVVSWWSSSHPGLRLLFSFRSVSNQLTMATRKSYQSQSHAPIVLITWKMGGFKQQVADLNTSAYVDVTIRMWQQGRGWVSLRIKRTQDEQAYKVMILCCVLLLPAYLCVFLCTLCDCSDPEKEWHIWQSLQGAQTCSHLHTEQELTLE